MKKEWARRGFPTSNIVSASIRWEPVIPKPSYNGKRSKSKEKPAKVTSPPDSFCYCPCPGDLHSQGIANFLPLGFFHYPYPFNMCAHSSVSPGISTSWPVALPCEHVNTKAEAFVPKRWEKGGGKISRVPGAHMFCEPHFPVHF